jgi:hypothetical protein
VNDDDDDDNDNDNDDDDFTGSRRHLLWTAVIWQRVTSTGRG